MGAVSLLSLARSSEPLTEAEFTSKALQLNWLALLSHEAFTRVLARTHAPNRQVKLTKREIEVLQWAAEGKTNEDIATILAIKGRTVKFHIENAVMKLGTSNRIAGVTRALMMGLLSDS